MAIMSRSEVECRLALSHLEGTLIGLLNYIPLTPLSRTRITDALEYVNAHKQRLIEVKSQEESKSCG